jgi:hypothetical protein
VCGLALFSDESHAHFITRTHLADEPQKALFWSPLGAFGQNGLLILDKIGVIY